MIYNLQDWKKKVLLHILDGEAGVTKWIEDVEAKPDLFPEPNKIIEAKINKYFGIMKEQYKHLNFDALTEQQIVDLILSQPDYKDRVARETPAPVSFEKAKKIKLNQLDISYNQMIDNKYPLNARLEIALGVSGYPVNERENMKTFIQGKKSAYNSLKQQIDGCVTVEDLDAINIGTL